MAESYNLSVGDELTLRIVSQAGEGSGVPEENWTIVGVVFQPYALSGNESMTTAVFMTFADAQYISGVQGFNNLYVRYTDFASAQAQSSNLTNAISTETPYIPYFAVVFDPAQNDQISTASSISTVLGMLGVVALLVSGFLVVNVINAIVVEQKRQIGVMKSLGASGWDNFVIYAGIALGYGLLGVIPGVLLGIPAGFFAAKAMSGTMGTIIDQFAVSPSSIIMGVVIGLAVPVLAALVPVFNGTRVKILDAMTDLGIDSNYGKSFFARLIGRLPLPVTVRQGLSNVVQKKGRLAFTVLTLTIAAGAFMGIFALFSSIGSVLNNTFDTYNVEILVQPDQPQDFATMSQLIQDNIEGVAFVQPHNGLQVEIEGLVTAEGGGDYGVFIDGYDPEAPISAFVLNLTDGVQLSESDDPNAIIITSGMAETLGKSVGDKIVIVGAGASREVTIVGISSFPFTNAWMRWETLADFAGYTLNGQPTSRNLLVKLNADDPTVEETADVIEDINERLLANGVTATYGNFPEIIEEISSLVLVFQVIFTVAAGLIAVVGALGLLTMISMSVFERQKEIGVMRSIGAGSFTVAMQFLTEGVIVGILAWVIGLPISYALNAVITSALGLGDAFKLTYPLSAPVAGVVGMLVITALASLYPSISASRKTVSDILRYQ
jgi:putative ABC transport system permease protein